MDDHSRIYGLVSNQTLGPTQPPTRSGLEMSTETRGNGLRREGNRRSVVLPAMRHKLCDISNYGLNGLMK